MRTTWPFGVMTMDEQPKPRLIAARERAAGPWADPRFWMQVAVLVGGLLAIYWTDRNSDTQQFAALNAVASQLSQGVAEIKGQVSSIDGSVRTLSGNLIALQGDVERLKQENEELRGDIKLHNLQMQTLREKLAATGFRP